LAKRFTDTGLYDKEWFQELELKNKVFWEYITKKCDHAGIWEVNIRMANYIIGANFKKDELLEVFKNRIIVVDNDKWFIPKFLIFQYGTELNDKNRVHNSVISRLNKVLARGLDGATKDLSEFSKDLPRGIEALAKGLRTNINTNTKLNIKTKTKEKTSKKKNGFDDEVDMITLYKWFVGEENLIGQSPTLPQRKLLKDALGHISLEDWKPYIDNMHEQVDNFGRQMPEMKFFFEGSYLKFKTIKEIE
tara:strand:- start:34 stop:777 length:744 start_codon:yes stop_codon:yes gene_type:complete